MQTRLEFDPTNTLQEWSLFKTMLNQKKDEKKPLLKGDVRAASLITHLTQRLQSGGMIKGV